VTDPSSFAMRPRATLAIPKKDEGRDLLHTFLWPDQPARRCGGFFNDDIQASKSKAFIGLPNK